MMPEKPPVDQKDEKPLSVFVSDIQRCCFDDGDGLRTTVFFKGCSLHCPWCHNPETISPHPVLLYSASRCVGCLTCAAHCPDTLPLPVAGEVNCAADRNCEGCLCPQDALRVSGRRMSLDALMSVIQEDSAYYAASGGGVTLSGGEPLMQPEACLVLAERCHAAGIPVLLDTAGCVAHTVFTRVLSEMDEIYLDLKLPPAQYAAVCGSPQDLEQNLDAVVHSGKRYALRIPLIPGFAAQPDMAREMVQFATARGIRRVHLLPYNPLAVSKYTQLGKSWPFPSGFTESALLTELLDIWRSRIPDTELKN